MTDFELLSGHKEIANFLGLTTRQVIWHDEQGNLPTFRIGRTVVARKAKLVSWIEEQEEAQRHKVGSAGKA